jgi:DNA-binding beta-propeller fold protein YncE
MSQARSLASILIALLLAGCGGGGGDSPAAPKPLGSLTDVDTLADAVSESARPGTGVGILVRAPELGARGGVTFALTDSSSGAFTIDPAQGVITIAGPVDFESTARRTVTVRAASTDGQFFAERSFVIEILDSPPPAIEIRFPLAHANYAHKSAGVSGRIVHPEPWNISVRASAGSAGTDGTVLNDGRFFVKNIAVADGDRMTLTVTASHAGNESDVDSISLGRAPELSIVEGLIVDSARDRYLLADRYSGTIVAIARNGYVRSVVSGAGRGAGPPFDEPVGLALDSDGGSLYVVDRELRAVFRVHPGSGDRTIVSSGSVITPGVGTGTNLLDPTAILFEPSRRTLLVVDDGRNSLVAIDPATGNRTTVSDNSPAYGATMNFWDTIALDAARNRAIVATPSIHEQYGVDLTTGVRSLVSDMARDIPNANRSFTGVTVAPPRGAAYLADDFSNAVVRMDLATGLRTSVTSSGLTAGPLTHPVIGSGPELEWPTAVLYDDGQDRLLVFEESSADSLIEIDEPTGNRTLLTKAAVGAGIHFKDPSGIVLDPTGRIAYVTDNIADIVVAVNLEDGSRQQIAGSPTGRGTIATDPLAVDVDSAAGELYIVDFSENSLYALNISTGARRTISDPSTGNGPFLDNPVNIAVDPAAQIAYVVDARLEALLAVELASGNRRFVAEGFRRPVGLELDAPGGLAYVSEADGNIYRVELATGQRGLLAATNAGELDDIAFDAGHGRLIALDLYPPRVLAIDLSLGTRTVLSGPTTLNNTDVGGGPIFEQPRMIAVDSSRQIAYVTENLSDAIIAVDLTSGYRQVIAR